VDVPEPAPQRSLSSADGALVRAVGRVPLPLGAKLLIGFAMVGALLAIGAVLGLGALGQSNLRGQQLRLLQERAVYYQLVLPDATQLRHAIENRIKSGVSKKRFGSGLDQPIARLCNDVGLNGCAGSTMAPLPVAFTNLLPTKLFESVRRRLFQFDAITGLIPLEAVQNHSGYVVSARTMPGILRQVDGFATSFSQRLGAVAKETRTRANALVSANRRSYSDSRNLLIGVAAGSLGLAFALGLLLAWSVVAPLRRTESRLDEIAAGDFTGRLDVPNRDEIGRLAAKVNNTSDELQRVQRELELASEHKSQFLANMSHELRTPLNAILGFSEVLQEQMFGELNERQLGYVEDVHEAGQHLLSLINDVLDLAKIEAGRIELELSQVAIPEVLRSAVSMHSERASRGGIELGLSTEPEEITVSADERRVRQIVFNLLSNAVKFTPPQGRIAVSAHLDDGQVEVAVADTGPGIPAGDLETIFEEFEQTSEGKKAEGTGLGLPLSRKLVELHGGRLWVESQPGKGSVFRFTLPVRQEASRAS
jgi:signal transduction histidine kinase